jgi:FkbM family methyltransferase
MKLIDDTLKNFQQGRIEKSDFIREMYEEHHAKLFDYAQHISRTNIAKIEIQNGQIIMTSRDRGVLMLCVPGDFRIAPVETLNFFDYEKSDAAMIDRLVGDGDVFYDIGANMGWYSINIALSRRGAEVHCFEPIPQTYDYLKKNLELNKVFNVKAYNFGFSNSSGEFDFYYYGEGSGNASSANVSNRKDVQIQKCNVRTLDDFSILQTKSVDFIKCDVEGAELMAFQGGLQTISRDRPIVFSEVLRKWSSKFNYNPNEIFDLFTAQGYRAFTVNGADLQEFFIMNESTLETNFFFLHKEKHAKQIKQYCP